MQNFLVNARYLGRPMTGVDRVGSETVRALQSHPEFTKEFQLREIRCGHSSEKPRSRLQQLFEEQIALSLVQRRDLMLSPANIGPALRRNHIVMMHDAQVYTQPDSYTMLFRARYKLLMPLIGRFARRIVVPSAFTKAELLRFRIATEDKISVVPNGADHILRVPADTSILQRHQLKPQNYFLAIGSLAPHKNLEMLVRASESRTDRSLPLVIAGGGDARVFKRLGLQQSRSVRMIGRVSDAALRALYDNAMALVFPSITEGFGLPTAEAMFCGCPVIATTGGAVPEVCGNATLQINPYDQTKWCLAMQRIATDADLRQRMIADGRRQVTKFTWRTAADQMASILKQCGSKNRAKSHGGSIGVATGVPQQSDLG